MRLYPTVWLLCLFVPYKIRALLMMKVIKMSSFLVRIQCLTNFCSQILYYSIFCETTAVVVWSVNFRLFTFMSFMVCIILTAIKCCFTATRVGTNATLISSQILVVRHPKGLSVIGSVVPPFNAYYQQITHWVKNLIRVPYHWSPDHY